MAVRARFDVIEPAILPAGGSIGQVLAKTSNTSFDTQWITPAIGGGGGSSSTTLSKSATYTETATSGDLTLLCTGTFTINLPTAAGNTARITAKLISGAVTLDPFGSETIDGGATAILTIAGASITIVSDETNWAIV